ncbi:hypothetical protein AVEN_261033-1 [Araneus ventricosus]|uniref:Uncharacterized protein n=1 Tax=Araneus ventricosus TaxID=182803 RepID=A0A4Y2P4X0_ARAVE|nr:hypothetical protein AVEN_261033-1 [Araneus ventricosus]
MASAAVKSSRESWEKEKYNQYQDNFLVLVHRNVRKQGHRTVRFGWGHLPLESKDSIIPHRIKDSTRLSQDFIILTSQMTPSSLDQRDPIVFRIKALFLWNQRLHHPLNSKTPSSSRIKDPIIL